MLKTIICDNSLQGWHNVNIYNNYDFIISSVGVASNVISAHLIIYKSQLNEKKCQRLPLMSPGRDVILVAISKQHYVLALIKY